jgi:hypothetical protein
MPKHRLEWRIGGAQERWPGREDFFEHLADDAAFQSLDVDDDVGQFGHF